MTKIFDSYSEFLQRQDKKENGVSKEFAKFHPNWEEENKDNEGCYNCSRCSDCSYQCFLDGEKGATVIGETLEQIGFPNVPVIENIHQAVFEAASGPKALDMGNWHTCDTTHCRAGWVEFLAGPEGKALADRTSTLFAAMQIYKKSSPAIRVYPPRFFEDNATALADMKKCAEEEAAIAKE